MKPFLSERGFITIVELPGEDPLPVIRGPLATVRDALAAIRKVCDVDVNRYIRTWSDIILLDTEPPVYRFIESEIAEAILEDAINDGCDMGEAQGRLPDWADEHVDLNGTFARIEEAPDHWGDQQRSCNPSRGVHL